VLGDNVPECVFMVALRNMRRACASGGVLPCTAAWWASVRFLWAVTHAAERYKTECADNPDEGGRRSQKSISHLTLMSWRLGEGWVRRDSVYTLGAMGTRVK